MVGGRGKGGLTVASDDKDAAEPHLVLPHLPGVGDGTDKEEDDEDDCGGDGGDETPEVVVVLVGEELPPREYRHIHFGGHGDNFYTPSRGVKREVSICVTRLKVRDGMGGETELERDERKGRRERLEQSQTSNTYIDSAL